MREKRTSYRLMVASLLVTVAMVGLGATAAGAKPAGGGKSTTVTMGPAGLRFYTPPRMLPRGPHGTLIWQRAFHGVASLRGAKNYLVLYKQIGADGKLVAVSGLVSIPKGKAPKGGWPVVSYAHGTTGIADACAPSRDTGPQSGAHRADHTAAALLNGLVKDGYAIVRTDYEGMGVAGPAPYLIGRSEGRGVLDIVRAARQLDPSVGRRMVISGHSQGGHAALWAASLAKSYTPELNLVGTLAFAPQSHTANEVSLLSKDSSTGLSPIAGLILRGIDVAYPSLRVSQALTPAAARLYPQTLTRCLGQLESKRSLGGLPLTKLVKPSANLAPLAVALKRNDPDTLRIRGPVLIEQGLADTTVFPAFDKELSQSLRGAGDSVTYHTYAGASHSGVLIASAKDATAFVKRRLGK